MTGLPRTWDPRSPAARYARARHLVRVATTATDRKAAHAELLTLTAAFGYATVQRLDAELDALEEDHTA